MLDCSSKRITRARAAAATAIETTKNSKPLSSTIDKRGLSNAATNSTSLTEKGNLTSNEKCNQHRAPGHVNPRRSCRARSNIKTSIPGSESTRQTRARSIKGAQDVHFHSSSISSDGLQPSRHPRGYARTRSGVTAANAREQSLCPTADTLPEVPLEDLEEIEPVSAKFRSAGKPNVSPARIRGHKKYSIDRESKYSENTLSKRNIPEGWFTSLNAEKATHIRLGPHNDDAVETLLKSPGRTSTMKATPSQGALIAVDGLKNIDGGINRVATSNAVILGSPPRRPPTSPSKDSLKLPAKRTGSAQLPVSLMSSRRAPLVDADRHPNSIPETTLLSPARRPKFLFKAPVFPNTAVGQEMNGQPFKREASVLLSPAKKPRSGAVDFAHLACSSSGLSASRRKLKPLPIAKTDKGDARVLRSQGFANTLVSDGGNFVDDLDSSTVTASRSPGKPPIVLRCGASRPTEQLINGFEFVQTGDKMQQGALLHHNTRTDEPERFKAPSGDLYEPSGNSLAEDFTVEEQCNLAASDAASQASTSQVVSPRDDDQLLYHGIVRGAYGQSGKGLEPSYKFRVRKHDSNRGRDSLCLPSEETIRSKPVKIALACGSDAFPPLNAGTGLMDAPAAIRLRDDDAVNPSIRVSKSTSISDLSASGSRREIHDSIRDVHVGEMHAGQWQGEKAESISTITSEREVWSRKSLGLCEDSSSTPKSYGDSAHRVVDPQLNGAFSEAIRADGDSDQLLTGHISPNNNVLPASSAAPSARPGRKVHHTITMVPLKPASHPETETCFQGIPIASKISFGEPSKTPKRVRVKSDETHREGLCQDTSPAPLGGVTALVDVYTTGGADASGIFIQLLRSMGARCIRTWHRNTDGLHCDGMDTTSNKSTITHVIFKDGGTRTMRKVRESHGTIQCVGVNWVLDCEREQKWLDETPYRTETSLVPQGRACRRRSMEPKAITDMDGPTTPSPKVVRNPLYTPKNRRESTLWMRTLPEQDCAATSIDDEFEKPYALLTPVLKNPAPETPTEYVPEVAKEMSPQQKLDLLSPSKEVILTRDCPVVDDHDHQMLDHGQSCERDNQALTKLIALRRRNLPFTPRIGSPLAKTWK